MYASHHHTYIQNNKCCAYHVPLLAGWFPTLTLPGCRPAIFQDLDSDRSKSDIVLCVIPDGDKVSVLFEYNTDLFDNATIVAMAETFTVVLAAAAAAPDTPLGQLTCLTGELQRQRLLQGLQGEVSVGSTDV